MVKPVDDESDEGVIPIGNRGGRAYLQIRRVESTFWLAVQVWLRRRKRDWQGQTRREGRRERMMEGDGKNRDDACPFYFTFYSFNAFPAATCSLSFTQPCVSLSLLVCTSCSAPARGGWMSRSKSRVRPFFGFFFFGACHPVPVPVPSCLFFSYRDLTLGNTQHHPHLLFRRCPSLPPSSSSLPLAVCLESEACSHQPTVSTLRVVLPLRCAD